jgi:hypothetical protein
VLKSTVDGDNFAIQRLYEDESLGLIAPSGLGSTLAAKYLSQ